MEVSLLATFGRVVLRLLRSGDRRNIDDWPIAAGSAISTVSVVLFAGAVSFDLIFAQSLLRGPMYDPGQTTGSRVETYLFAQRRRERLKS